MPAKPPADDVGLALSGGGVRALMFGLGALRAVIAARDQRPGSKLSLLIGVSGGAIAAAFTASRVDISQTNLDEYDTKGLRPAAWAIPHRSMMFAGKQAWAVLGGAAGLVGGGLALAVLASMPWPLRIVVGSAG